MLIKLTMTPGHEVFYLDGELVVCARRHPENKLTTLVMTKMMTPNGPLTFEVHESPEEVAASYNVARSFANQHTEFKEPSRIAGA